MANEKETKIEIFIAHDHRDDELANNVMWELEALGASTFIAPPDINPSEDWRKEIFAHLTTCTALVALITENFSQSAYANQEAGIVLGKEKPVVPIRIGEVKIPGFIESRQAIPASKQTISEAAKRAFNFARQRDPAFIRTGFVSHSAAKGVAIQEVKDRILWLGKGEDVNRAFHVTLYDRDIIVNSLGLNEKNKTYEVRGDAEFFQGRYSTKKKWVWSISIDAISGDIIASHTQETVQR